MALLATGCLLPPLGRKPAPKAPPERSIVFPLAREVSFTDSFGAPRSGGRSHQGQDLMAPKLTPIVAVADGTISYLKWSNDGLSGNFLILTDDEGWKYYYIHINNDSPFTDDGHGRYDAAFFDGIRTGQRVKAGEMIAFVGDSGDAESTGSHLHFELHRPDGSVVNAFNTLAAGRMYVRTVAEAAADAPVGNFEVMSRSGGTVSVSGWALDRVSNSPVHVSVYVDGNPVAGGEANLARADVASAYPGRGANHGYSISGVTAAPGAKVCMILHSIGGGGSARQCATAP